MKFLDVGNCHSKSVFKFPGNDFFRLHKCGFRDTEIFYPDAVEAFGIFPKRSISLFFDVQAQFTNGIAGAECRFARSFKKFRTLSGVESMFEILLH